MTKIKIGTRKSKLALWQANHIADLLSKVGFEPEIVTFETKGDKILDVALSKIGSKGVFTQELEEALRTGEIDIAQHSAKDLPSELDADLPLIAFTEREIACDVVVSLNKDLSLNDPITIGTSSTRRVALLKHYYPHIKITDMRGNLQTRFGKMEERKCDAMLLAFAGVHRMGFDQNIITQLSKDTFVPPVGQGSVALQTCSSRISDEMLSKIRVACNHTQTEACILAERAFLRHMNGGCSIPVFGHATLDGETITLEGGIVSLNGQEMIKESLSDSISNAEKLGTVFGEKILSLGGDRILREIREELD